jgi:5-methylcytosine-specific restriction endonuclease McrA
VPEGGHAGKGPGVPYRDPEKRRAAAREATRRWYQRNKERLAPARRKKDRERYALERDSVLVARRERYANDPSFSEKIRSRNRDWYEGHREPRRESKRRYYVNNAAKLRAQGRERNRKRYAENPRAQLDYYKKWRLRNLQRARAYVRVSNHKRRAAAGGQHFTFEEWEAVLKEHAGHCAYCGSTDRIEADHRTPLCRGGSNLISNILPACQRCNRRKHRRTEEEFRALLQAERALAVLRESRA